MRISGGMITIRPIRNLTWTCTNYVSQCLRAGGAPMWGYPNREKGWWIQGGTWSLSWSTSHSLRWYLGTSKKGLTATRVVSAD